MDMMDVDIVLGIPWLEDFNPDVNWTEKMWAYCMSEGKVELQSAGHFLQVVLVPGAPTPAGVGAPQSISNNRVLVNSS